MSRGGYGDRYAPFIRAATHAKGIGVTHGTRYRTVGIRGTSHIGECVVVASVWCTDDAHKNNPGMREISLIRRTPCKRFDCHRDLWAVECPK